MNKVKKFEISVVDRTYSKVISDVVKFYSSDSALEVIFILAEEGYEFDSAELVLSNTDGSLITRPLTKSPEGYSYEIEKNIISHHGEWKGQVILNSVDNSYVSSKIRFTIEDDLLGARPPKLTDVYSWTSLKRYADGLVDELKQSVLEVEGMGDIFNANESERQVTFESNESERNQTFESNEYIRQSQELEREGAEATRQTVFDGNEANRTETFNTNEATRQENETERQQAETQRESAESSRMSAEEQRKIDHSNRSAELAGKADKVVLKNLVENGDFSDGIKAWSKYQSDITAENNVLTITSLSDGESPYIFQRIYVEKDDIVYGMAKAKPSVEIRSMYMSFDGTLHSLIENPTPDVYHPLSFVHKKAEDNMNYIVRMRLNSLAAGVKLEIKELGLINLTQTFGAGNEPTKEEMDELIKTTGYIDEEYALNNKEMLIWTLALIRRNKNAIITLGGTI